MDTQDHKKITQEEFSRQAEQIVTAPSFNDSDTLNNIVEAVGATYQDRILDVACGTGVVAFCLAKTAKEVIGLDITGEMLQRARKARHKKGISNVHFQLGDVERLPFDDEAFDITVCRMSIHHFSNPQAAINEMVRVTRIGGKVVFADIITSDDVEVAELHNAIERLRDPSHVRMLTHDELLALAAGCNLHILKTDNWSKQRHFPEWAEILNAPERIEPLKVVLQALAKNQIQAGINLCLDKEGQPTFEHRWSLILSEKLK